MRYAVLSWDSMSLREYRRGETFDDFDAACEVAERVQRNPRIRMAVVVAMPDKPRPEDRKMILPDEAPYTIPRALTGNAPRDGDYHPRPKCHGCGRPVPRRAG